MQSIELLGNRTIQDYRSTYNDIRDWLRREKSGKEAKKPTIDWDDVVFEIHLIKSQEIDLDYILELIFKHNKKTKDKAFLIEEIRRVIRASIGNKAKERLVVNFINKAELNSIKEKTSIIDSFFTYAQGKMKGHNLIQAIARVNRVFQDKTQRTRSRFYRHLRLSGRSYQKIYRRRRGRKTHFRP